MGSPLTRRQALARLGGGASGVAVLAAASSGLGRLPSASATGGAAFYALDPARVCDTRAGTGPSGPTAANPLNAYAGSTLQPYRGLRVPLSGPIGPDGARQQLVAPGAVAAVVGVSVVNYSAPGNLIVYPANLPQAPNTSTLVWPNPAQNGGTPLGTSITAKLGACPGDNSGRAGVIVLNASDGTLDVILDLTGYFA